VGLLGPCGAFTEPCRPLTFRCHSQAHPSRHPIPPDVLSVITLLADGEAEFTCEPEDPCFALPVRARRAKARKRLPSSREPASLHPQAMHKGNLLGTLAHAHRFAFCPSALRVSGATDFFLASALSSSPTGLATSRWRRRAMRPTDFCHPYERRAPAPRAFPARSRDFRRGDAPRRLRLRAVNRGTGCFTASETASADRHATQTSRTLLPCGLELRAWAFSSHGADDDRASDTPVAILTAFHPHASPAFTGAASLGRTSVFWTGWYGSEGAEDRRDHRERRLVKAFAS